MSSSVWVALATPNSPAGAVTFIDPASLTPNVDVLNFYYESTNKLLNLAHNGDVTNATDTINIYKQMDSYLPNVSIVVATNVTPGFTVSSSRGTGIAPTILQTLDYLGKFSGFGYTGAIPAYVEMAGLWLYAVGATANDLGGELHFVTKANAGVLTDRLTLDNAGNLFPTVNAGAQLGKSGFGFKQLNLDYTNSATIGAVAINKAAGSGNIAAAAASVVVTNNLVTANSLVIAWLMFVDATLTFVKSVIPAAGSFTVTGNAAATANTKFGFFVINTDS